MVYQLDYLSGNYATIIQLKRFTTLILLLMTPVMVNTCESVSRVSALSIMLSRGTCYISLVFYNEKQSTF